jgi:hypothetical protein
MNDPMTTTLLSSIAHGATPPLASACALAAAREVAR